MGNICGKADPDAFSSPGRIVGSTPPARKTSSVPNKVGGPPRRLGSNVAATPASGEQSSPGPNDVRTKVRNAALARDQSAKESLSGRLGSKLAADKSKTTEKTRKDDSKERLRIREIDEAAKARNYD